MYVLEKTKTKINDLSTSPRDYKKYNKLNPKNIACKKKYKEQKFMKTCKRRDHLIIFNIFVSSRFQVISDYTDNPHSPL